MSNPLKLTRGERLFIWRRRKGINQEHAAYRFKVHVDIYRDWERDKREKDQPSMNAGSLSISETCVILRRRAGMTQRELADKMEITRLWVIQMEDGVAPIDRLRRYWGV